MCGVFGGLMEREWRERVERSSDRARERSKEELDLSMCPSSPYQTMRWPGTGRNYDSAAATNRPQLRYSSQLRPVPDPY